MQSIYILGVMLTATLAYYSFAKANVLAERFAIDSPGNVEGRALLNFKDNLNFVQNPLADEEKSISNICSKDNQSAEKEISIQSQSPVTVAGSDTQAPTETASPAVTTKPVSTKKPVVAAAKPKLPSGYIAPGLKAGYPAIYKKDSQGRLVCPTKNDKPAKSKKDKPTHIDMECCLDPDEIPNPHCYYPREKYGKLLDRYNNEKKQLFIDRVTKKKKK